MSKIKNFMYKSILIILFIFTIYVTYCSIFNVYKSQLKINSLIIIIGVIVLILTFIQFKKIFGRIKEKYSNLFAIVICVLFFILMVIFGKIMTAVPTYDLSNIQKEAMIMLKNGGKFVTEEYFGRCTNNVPIAILVYYIYRLGEILRFDNLRFFGVIINSLFIAITAFFTYLSVKRLKDSSNALVTLLFFIINPIFYIYSSYYYTYTLCMPFAALAIYFMILAVKSKNKKTNIILILCSGISLAIGFEIRVVVGIILLAFIISFILNNKFNKKVFGDICLLILGFIIGICIYTLISLPFGVIKNKNLELPVTHYIMYSLNDEYDGRWNEKDFNYTYSQKTYDKKVKSNVDEIKNRIKKLGLKGWIELSKTKMAVNWSNGDYDYIPKFLNVESFNKLYEYIVGNRKVFMIYSLQIFKATILVVFMIAVLKEIIKKDKEKLYSVIYISMFGAFLFYLFWEVATSYSLPFLPWMFIVFSIGITQIENVVKINIIKCELEDIKDIQYDFRKVKNIMPFFIIICSIFLIILNYYPYTKEKNLYWDKRVMQYKESGKEILVTSSKNIQQTFKTNKEFNCISVKFKKENVSGKTNYNFILKDENNKVLVTQIFTSTDIKNNQLKTFYFKKIKPEKSEKYIIEIKSDNATEKDAIGLAVFNEGEYKAYIGGNLIIDNETTDADLVFQVQNEIERTYTSKRIYIILSFAIIILELFAFYSCIVKRKVE